MKILYIITQADGGGAQNYTLALAKHFGGAIAAGSLETRLFKEAKNARLETFPLQHLKRNIHPYHDFLAVWEIRQLIKIYRPDIVHLNSSKAGVVGSFAGLGLKAKIVFTAHGFIFNEPLPFWLQSFYLALEKTASAYRNYIICVSEADHKSALDNNLIKPEKISTIHNGLPAVTFLSKDEARLKLNLSANKIIIGCVANFYKTKGVDVLIEAISLLNDEQKQKIQVVLIGDGPEKTSLSTINYNLSTPVTFLGKIPNASAYLKAFDLFILPSRKEGFPFALLEAMQAGLPIVATETGGIPEALDAAGILVEKENPAALSKALAHLIENPSKQKTLSQEALQRAKLFTQTKMLEETEKIYQKLLKP